MVPSSAIYPPHGQWPASMGNWRVLKWKNKAPINTYWYYFAARHSEEVNLLDARKKQSSKKQWDEEKNNVNICEIHAFLKKSGDVYPSIKPSFDEFFQKRAVLTKVTKGLTSQHSLIERWVSPDSILQQVVSLLHCDSGPYYIMLHTLSIKNHWMAKANPWSRCCEGNSLSNEGIFIILLPHPHAFPYRACHYALFRLFCQNPFWPLEKEKSSVAQCSTGWFKNNFLECSLEMYNS